jgi:GntR family transcriptional regulator / MocR family aminotransferase
VTAFEQLQAEGYLVGMVGAGTWVNERLPEHLLGRKMAEVQVRKLPGPVPVWALSRPARPFRPYEPAISEFPIEIWARVAGRRAAPSLHFAFGRGWPPGYGPLREAAAGYLGSSRGVNCSPDQIVIVSGVQQGLDLLARFLVKPGEAVGMEDPGYFGATAAFRNAGAKIIPLPVDEHGLVISRESSCTARSKPPT